VTGLLVALAGLVVVSESMLVQERKKKRLPTRMCRDVQRTVATEDKVAKRLLENTFVGKADALVSLNKN
jgi:hypothetical protein